jgi:glycosyltransferase involved in cell wall biosynthesis
MAVVPNGVELEKFGLETREAAKLRLGLNGRLILGFVGSFQPWHRVDQLLDAVASLCSTFPIHILMAGEGSGLEATEAYAARLGITHHITATGSLPTSEIPALLAACDIGVLPGSNDYGQPMKVVEYAAAGLPIVAPDLPPVREVLKHEHTGLLFPPGDTTALSEVIARLAEDGPLRARLGRAARESVEESTWAKSAARLESVLSQVLSNGRPR